MKKIFVIFLMFVLISVSLTVVNTAERNIYINEDSDFEKTQNEDFYITDSKDDEFDSENEIIESDCNDYIFYLDGGYPVLAALPDKTQEQIDKMIQDPEPTIASADLPSSFSWTNFGGDWSTPAKDQGNCGSCWAFAALGAMEGAINIAKGDPHFDRDLSEQYILSCLSAAGSCSGGWMSEAIEYIKSTNPGNSGNGINGVPLESCMPYKASSYIPCADKCDNWDYYTNPPAEDNILFQVLDFGVTQINPSSQSDWNLLKSWIITYGPLSVDIYASSGWSSFWSTHHSPTDVYEGSESGTTNHAQVLYGWVDDASVKNGGYWILKNSWGTSFGYGGFNNLAYGCLRLGDRDVTWVTTPAWPGIEEPVDPINPVYFVYAGWSFSPDYPKIGNEIEFQDESAGPVVLWNWDFTGDGIWDVSGSGSSAKRPKWTYYSEGDYPVALEVWSSSGLSSTLTKTVQVKEVWPPVAVIKPEKVVTNKVEVTLEGRYSYDRVGGYIVSYHWDFDDGTTSSAGSVKHVFSEIDRLYEVTLTVTNNEGLTDSVVCPVYIDVYVPPETVAVIGFNDDESTWYSSSQRVELIAQDWSGVRYIYYRVNGGSWKSKYFPQAREFETWHVWINDEGDNILEFYSVDFYGNIESIKSRPVRIDRTVPSLNMIVSANNELDGLYTSPVEVSLSASDTLSGVNTIYYAVETLLFTEYTKSFTLGGGTHQLWTYAVDKAGNIGKLNPYPSIIYVDTKEPSEPEITGPSSVSAGQEYEFSFVSNSPAQRKIKYYVEWGDGTSTGWTAFVDSAVAVTLSHNWAEKNSYSVRAKAMDDFGSESDWSTKSISVSKSNTQENTQPTYNNIQITSITPNGPVNAQQGETITFTITTTGGSGNHYYQLYTGDGTTKTGYMNGDTKNIQHTYNTQGTYQPDILVHDLNTYYYDSNYDFATLTIEQTANDVPGPNTI